MLTSIVFAIAAHAVVVEKNIEAVMRDGVVLRADIYRPDEAGRFPALLKRTPYSKGDSSDQPLYRRLASEGFVVAIQDTRGRYTSDGVAVPHDEAEDGHDTVEWLAGLSYMNGKVGMFGGSYEATTQLTAASLRPEGLVAIFPASSYASRYDPSKPVPTPSYAGYSRAPDGNTMRDIQTRDDVLVYTTPPLDRAIEVTGYIELVLWAASSARDTDFTGRVLDVSPDGTSRALSDGILRARYRNGYGAPELLTPGEPVELRVELGATSNVFLPGHRIQLELSSSNFPRYNRNPNTGRVFAQSAELVTAEQTIFRDSARTSRLILPIVPREENLETKLDQRNSRDRISAFHQSLTARPHRAGTEGSRAVAEYLATSLEDAGLDVEVFEYYPHLSSPRRIEIEVLAPTPEKLTVWEPPDPRDPSSTHPELEPGFVAYSASGTVTGFVVYVGYGLPADYEELDTDVEGKIALARYGRSHRGVKVHTAQERGALGLILYSDPEDDGALRGTSWPEGP